MHVRRGPLDWGVFLILVGAVPLAVRAGYLTDEQVGRLWSLWPLILVGLGVGLILRRTRLDFLGGLVIAATLGLMAGGLLSGGVRGVTGFPTGACGNGTGEVAFPTRTGTLSASSSAVDLRLDCGSLTVVVAPGTAWRVEGKGPDDKGPDITSSDSSLRVSSGHGQARVLGPFSGQESWTVTLPDGPHLDVSIGVDAGSATVDLGSASLDKFGLDLNAGSATIDLISVRGLGGFDVGVNAGSVALTLPNVSFSGSIEANAASVKLCAPPGAGLKLHTEGALASYAYAGHGLVENGSTWTTPGFEGAAVKIELRTKATVGSFTLDPEDGCD